MNKTIASLLLLGSLLALGACDVFVQDTPDNVVIEDRNPDIVIEDKTPDIVIEDKTPDPPADVDINIESGG